MKRLLFPLLLVLHLKAFEQAVTENYKDDSASIEHTGVPRGETLKFVFDNSKIFPGTWREYWIYIPAQYRSDRPACVYVSQDGVPAKAATIFDNLIASGEMPVTIGVFVSPGRIRLSDAGIGQDRFNRSFEYDGLGDTYVRFLLEEIFPDVEKQKATDGRPIKLSKSGNDRAIGGYSSGAICAFTAAWERTGEFSRVFSAIGTYVGLRGGERYPTLIRKYEPKPIRIYLQDGANDLNIYGGDWWKANEMMERALTFSGYEVKHSWGEGSHNGKHGTAIFPEALRWLWKGWPSPVAKGNSRNQFLSDILIEGEDWELVGEGYKFTEGTAANANGEVYFQDIPLSKTYKTDRGGKLTELKLDAKKASACSFDSVGNRYTSAGGTNQILKYDQSGKETVVADSIAGNDLVVARNGNIYVTVPDGISKPGKIVLVRPNGEKIVVDNGLKFPNGIALSPDQRQLYVTESASHWVWIFQVRTDGTLANKQQYGWLHVPDNSDNAWADGLKCDTAGRVYVATRLGIQIMDQLGRVNAILPVPSGQSSNLCFGGTDFSVIYATSVDKVYRRKLKTRGANSFEIPIRPQTPKL